MIQSKYQPSYIKRPLDENLITQLTSSTRKAIYAHGPSATIGLINNARECRYVQLPLIGWSLFMHCYGKRASKVPISNVWMYDLGKLVVPNILMDVDLARKIASHYDENSRIVREENGGELIQIDNASISKVFGLKLATNKVIDVDQFKQKYQ